MTAAGRSPARVETGTGWYVYGVVPAAEAPDELFDGVLGVAGGAVSLVAAGRLGAIATAVPLEEFGEEPLAEHLRDPEWLERSVRAHEEVLEAALRAVPVVPFRFGTIYHGEAQVRDVLTDDERLAAALERVRGKVELGVKGFLAAAPAADTAPAEAAFAPGRRYLEAKQRARRLGEERESLKARLANETHERLAAAADDAVANPLQPREVVDGEVEMFLNGAYLVGTDDAARFHEVLAELEREFAPAGATYELTGPWPPYNFVEAAA